MRSKPYTPLVRPIPDFINGITSDKYILLQDTYFMVFYIRAPVYLVFHISHIWFLVLLMNLTFFQQTFVVLLFC